jgi:FkbM family methyltransferase
MSLGSVLKRSRENYYASLLFSAAGRPIYRLARFVADQIQKKVRCNGVCIALPNGSELRLARNAGVTLASNLAWHGLEGYEPATARTLRFFFERSRTFVDVGANYGFYSLLGALWNSSLRVLAFEPVPEIYDGLKRNITLNHVNDRVTPVCQALSNTSGTATFYLPPSEGCDRESTGTLAAYGWQNRPGSARLQVQTTCFDDFEKEHRCGSIW